MRSFRISERGASAWPLVIAILLFLAAVYLLFDKTSQHDELQKVVEATKDKHREVQKKAAVLVTKLKDLTKVVGFPTDTADVSGLGLPEASIPIADATAIKHEVNPQGMRGEGENAQPGLAKTINERALLRFSRTARQHAKKVGKAVEVKAPWATQALADALQKLSETHKALAEKPEPPYDPDDTEGMATYTEEMDAWNEKMRAFNQALDEVSKMDGYKEASETIAGPGEFGPAEENVIEVRYFPTAVSDQETLQSLLMGVGPMIEGMRSELKAYVEAANGKISGLETDNKSKDTSLAAKQTELEASQQAHQETKTELEKQRDAAEGRANEASAKRQEAVDELASVKQKSAEEKSDLTAERDAYKVGLANAKEVRDHAIRRNVSKAQVLAVSSTGNTVINIGRRHHAFQGLRLQAMAHNRAGVRVPTGEVLVTQVLGSNSSRARIVSGVVREGYSLHNPLYGKDKPIRVVIHGTLEKWPLSVLTPRLKALNVEIQEEMNGRTDYVIVPNSLAAPKVKAESEDEEEAEEDPKAKLLETIQNRARTFGAKVLTERLFDEFLDF